MFPEIGVSIIYQTVRSVQRIRGRSVNSMAITATQAWCMVLKLLVSGLANLGTVEK